MPRGPIPVGRTTLLAALGVLAVTGVFAVAGGDMVLEGLRGEVDLESVVAGSLWGFGRDEMGAGKVLAGSAVLILCGMTGGCGIGMLRGRGWAREGALLLMSGYALVLLPASVAGMFALEASPGAPLGLAIALVEISILVALLSRSVADDFADDWSP